MDRALYLTPPAPTMIAQLPTDQRPLNDKVVAPLRRLDPSPPLPPDHKFVAQAVAAQLRDDEPAPPAGEIMPDERRLRPYGVPMLPADRPDPA
jgi:hypothetical protein